MSTVKTRIVKIGNSQGIRIPKVMLQQAGFDDAEDVTLEVHDGKLIVSSTHRPRQGWDRRFQEMAAREDDRMLEPEVTTGWDEREWEW